MKENLANMLLDHAVDKDILIYGPKSSGKSITARLFACILGYEIETVFT